jgi:CheY-like chemotaxis protein
MKTAPIRNIVLCIDDEEVILCLLQSTLMANGYAVLTTTDGPSALKLMSGRRVDAIILDYSMPGMNGDEVAVEMKRMRPDVPIILFSGSCDIPSRALGRVDAFVQKGTGLSRLLAVLEQLLQDAIEQTFAVRRFPRYSAQLPLVVTVMRSGEPTKLHGVSRSFGEGGLGGRIDGKLIPGEYVRIRIMDQRLEKALEPHAQVRYRKDDTYGFSFLDVNPPEQANVRQLCEQLAIA